MGLFDVLGGTSTFGAGSTAQSVGASFGTAGGTAIGGLGAGLSLFGGLGAMSASQQMAGTQQQMIGTEMQENALRQTAMNVSARRNQMEILRNNQKARAQAQASATNQGAQFGSGLQGGLAQISGESGTNLVGVNQNQQSSNQMFGLDYTLDQQKMQYAQEQSSLSTSQGMSSLGGTLGGIMGIAKNLLPMAFAV